MNQILVKTTKPRERYRIINGSMGCAGSPDNSANHKYQIAEGIDRGNGYQGYMSVSYFMSQSHIPQSAKNRVAAICKAEGLIYTA